MMFWALAYVTLLVATGITLSPLLGRLSSWKLPAWGAIAVLPVLALLLYRQVGTPAALDAIGTPPAPASVPGDQPEMSDLITQLQARLQEKPDSLDGWMLLGRSYKTLQQYPQAVEAFETAERLEPGNPLIATELVEARLFASGNPVITAGMVQQLKEAVSADPGLQKALWLLGIAAAQSGNEAEAVGYWENLLAQLEPGSEIAQTVAAQIAEVSGTEASAPMDGQTKETPPTKAEEAWQGVRITVGMGDAANKEISVIPAGAVLFVIVRDTMVTGGPPLGVRRVDQPALPVQLELTDADSMMPQRPISASEGLSLQARLSLSGRPTPSPGDWQSPVLPLNPDQAGAITLILEEEIK